MNASDSLRASHHPKRLSSHQTDSQRTAQVECPSDEDTDASASAMGDFEILGDPLGETLVVVQTWGSERASYPRLANLLAEWRILCLFPPDPAKHEMPRRTEQWVAHHLATLRSVGVPPSVSIIGWSFGGVIAVEIARTLRSEGIDVRYCGLIDTRRPVLRPVSNREFFWHHLSEASRMTDEEARRRYLRRKGLTMIYRKFPRLGNFAVRAVQRLGYLHKHTPANPATKPADPLRVAIYTAYLNYRGEEVDFPVHLYDTEESSRRAQTSALGWIGYLGRGYRITRVPGDHLSLFDETNITKLAKAVRVDLTTALPTSQHPIS